MNLVLPYHVRPGTLAYYKAQPLFQKQDMREHWVPAIATRVQTYLNHCGLVSPESEAINFYAGNALMAELLKKYGPEEVLPPAADALARWYVKWASATSQRLAYYLFLIITRESRHVSQSINPQLKVNFGTEYAKFNAYMSGATGSMHAKELFFQKPPKVWLGHYAEAISWTFHHGKYGSAFGGPKWAAIADVFKALVLGEFTPEMMTDVSWALCHNGGPIFNKGMTYTHYDAHTLKLILDVQRAGQIPELVQDTSLPAKDHVHAEVKAQVAVATGLFPGVFTAKVDWVAVEKAGSVQKYPALKKKQLAGDNAYWVTPDTMVTLVKKQRVA